MQAQDVMSSPVYIVAPSENIAHVRNLMLKHKISRLLVMDGDALAGIITKKDIAYRLRQSEPIWRRRPIDRIPVSVLMMPDPMTIPPDTGTREIAALMLERDISGFPVADNGAVIGIVTKTDLLRSSQVDKLELSAGDVMVEASLINRYHSLDHVIDQLRERNDKLVVINNDGTIAGIITESNLAFFEYLTERDTLPEKDVVMLRRDESGGRKQYRYVVAVSAVAEDLMTRPVVTITPDTPLKTAVHQMLEKHINSVVVVDGKEVKGIVKRDDILQEVAK